MHKIHKTDMLNARIEPVLKRNAEQILKKLGLSNAEAIRIFYTLICLNQGLPFNVKIPNQATRLAIKDADLGNTLHAKSVDELL